MAKSKYPDKLDTSIEIPAVRDNIIEIGSDVLNSVRTAIFQIERTLGINPQGAVGNTVSDRLNKSLDGNGNILKEALDRANVLSGPVVDKDVSKNAAINESKLRLNYPTQLLQDEISQLISQLTIILTTLEELAVLLNAHVHPDATNRHYAKAITVEAIDSTGSEVGMVSVDVATAQEVFEQIFQSHINYDGSDISISNRSHEADQLFFDNEDVSAYTSAEDVQEAIEDVYEYTIGQLDIHQNKQHDNGILKSSVITSPEDSDEGVLLVEESGVNYSATSPSEVKQAVVVRFDDPPDTPDIDIKKSDILKITDNSGSTEYQIFKVNYSSGGSTIESVEVYGYFIESSSSVSAAKIYRNINKEANHGGLLATAREYQSITATSYSNADIIQIANPDASTIISNHINPSEISLTNRYFNITVDDGSEIELDIYDGTAASQSLDTIIKNLNAQFSENASSVSAYRVDYDENKSPELALVHSIPSDISSSHTLMVSRGSDDALDSLGLEKFEDTTINSGLGTAYYIQGKEYSSLGTKMAEIGLTLLSGTASVTSSSVDFEEYGIREGDLLVVSGSPSDDGTYVILLVTTSSLVVDRNQLSGNKWSGESDAETEFYIYKNSISLNQMEFDISGTGGANGSICDVFMDYNRNVFYNVRLEYGIEAIAAGNSLISIVDFNGDVSSYEGTLLAEPDGTASYTILTLDDGPPIELKGVKNQYIELKSGTHDIRLLIYIENSDNILTFFISASDITIPILGHEGVNEEENMLLSRALFESGSARIAGAGAEFPRLFRKMRRGNISQKDLGTDAIYANQQRPLNETRSNGVIFGLEVSPSATSIDANNHYTIDIVPGVCYVKGKRFKIDKKENLITGIVAAPTGPDNFFVAVDQWGSIVFAPADGVTCECPFDPSDYCILSSVEYDLATVVAIDLRLLINDLDLTVLNSITVSPQKGMGHFSNINKALKYAKRFSKMFPKAGIPTVHLKSGVHKLIVEVDGTTPGDQEYSNAHHKQGMWLDFPINITGEGHSTVIDIYEDEEFDKSAISPDASPSYIFIIGSNYSVLPDGSNDTLEQGTIRLNNLRLRQTNIYIVDPDLYDDSGNTLQFLIDIDNVCFDSHEYVHATSTYIMTPPVNVVTETGNDCGNILIKNCLFLNTSGISFTNILAGTDYTGFRNISIINNLYDKRLLDGTELFAGLFHRDYLNFNNIPAENNFEARNNIPICNDDVTQQASEWGVLGASPWGDRVSRNMYIGGQVGIGTSTWASGDEHSSLIVGDYSAVDGKVFIRGTDTIDGDGDSDSRHSGPLIIGDKDSYHMAIGGRGIQARMQDSFVGDLQINQGSSTDYSGDTYINYYGGDIQLLYKGKDNDPFATVKIGGTASGASNTGDIFTVDGNSHMDGDLHVMGDIILEGTLTDGSVIDGSPGDFDIGGALDVTDEAVIHDYLYVYGDFNAMGDTAHFNVCEFDVNCGTALVASFTSTNDRTRFLVESTFATGNAELEVKAGLSGIPILYFKNGATERWKVYSDYNSSHELTFEDVFNNVVLRLGTDSSVRLDGASTSIPIASGLLIRMENNNSASGGLHIQSSASTKNWVMIYGGGDTSSGDLVFCKSEDTGSSYDVAGYIEHNSSMGKMNFTGQHRSIADKSVMTSENIGKIVVAIGNYKNLNGNNKPTIMESLPAVELSSALNDKRAFGIIAEFEIYDDEFRKYHGAGSFVSVAKKEKGDERLLINSLGEGAVWVCNINGDLENGDYITTCEIPGYGMKQDDDLLHNYTVAKITQDCDFDLNSNNYDCVEFEFDGQTYKKAFVGCTYHCG